MSRIYPEFPAKFQRLFEPARYKACWGGRGSAKSHSLAKAAVIQVLQRGLRVLCAREIQKSLATSVHQLLVDKITEMNMGAYFNITRTGIECYNGGKFLFAGLRTNPDSIKSMEGLDIAWVEEADRCAQTSLDLLTPTIRKPGSEIWFSWNRRHKTDPVDFLFLGGQPPPGSILIETSWRDNPWFKDSELYEEMVWMKNRDHDKWLHVWEGHPLSISEAKVFKNWKEDDLDDEIPDGTIPRFGADWGFSVDPTVLVKCFLLGRRLYIADEAYRVRCEIDDIPSLFAGSDKRDPPRWINRYKHRGIPDVLNGIIRADSARPDTISYLNTRGFTVKSARKGARSVEEGVEFLQSYDIFVHPRCRHTITELQTYSFKVDPHTEEVLPELADKDNHVIDSLRYALENDRRNTGGRVSYVAPQIVTAS